MKSTIKVINRINEFVGTTFSWFTGFLVLLIFIDVLMRYLFNFTLIWIVELETYFFALIFLLGGGYTLLHQKHVRVDLFYSNFSERRKAWVNLFGGVFFLLPWSAVSFYVCWNYFISSWQMGESSGQPGGLPALYLLKFILFVGFFLLALQAVANILNSILVITNKSDPDKGVSIKNKNLDGTWEL